MRIIKVLSKTVKDKDYYKFIVSIPKDVVEQSELVEKQLKAKAEKKRIVIEEE
jgi:hypothetical protein